MYVKILFFLFSISSCSGVTDVISTCIGITPFAECEERTIKIGDQYYSCHLIDTYESAPTRLYVENDTILYYLDGAFYSISIKDIHHDVVPRKSNGYIVWDLETQRYNYYQVEGKLYAYDKTHDKELEVLPVKQFDTKILAVDEENSNVFVLVLNSNGFQRLYLVNDLSPTDGKTIVAKTIEGFQGDLKSIAVHSPTHSIVLSMNWNGKGKLLYFKETEPCRKKTEVTEKCKKCCQTLTQIKQYISRINKEQIDELSQQLSELEDLTSAKNLQLVKSNMPMEWFMHLKYRTREIKREMDMIKNVAKTYIGHS